MIRRESVDVDGRVALVTLERRQRRNAMDAAWQDLRTAVLQSVSAGTRALVITARSCPWVRISRPGAAQRSLRRWRSRSGSSANAVVRNFVQTQDFAEAAAARRESRAAAYVGR
jgi:enoyl-CoA hydratase/carnithine racemase